MTEDLIVTLLKEKGVGSAVFPITPVTGGFMHKMYRVDTDNGSFAVKRLNPDIMKRPGALERFGRAEYYERVLEDAGVPIVPALTVDGSKMQLFGGEYFYIFRWQDGKVTDWNNITAEQCRAAGGIQGMIHAIDPRQVPKTEPGISTIDWDGYIREASGACPEICTLLEENRELLIYAEAAMNEARTALPGTDCIVDEDMDPKNVMWVGGKPVVIDLECLERGDPVSSVLQLSLQWAGVTMCCLDLDKLKAFFDGYREAYDNGFSDYGAVFGLAYTWVEWLEYNITRALGRCADEAEREMGISQVKLTVARIRFLRDMEDRIKQNLERWFG